MGCGMALPSYFGANLPLLLFFSIHFPEIYLGEPPTNLWDKCHCQMD